ncbi:hypothetical protein HDU80_006032 [Chytriomyces hyalinus]|nr:hypothetical protein HDU80_006032 [Chytriomyces hyalinus]
MIGTHKETASGNGGAFHLRYAPVPLKCIISRQFDDYGSLDNVIEMNLSNPVLIPVQIDDAADRELLAGFLNSAKSPSEKWLPDSKSPTGDLAPSEIAILQQLRHPNIIQYIDHMVEANKVFKRSYTEARDNALRILDQLMMLAGETSHQWTCSSVSSQSEQMAQILATVKKQVDRYVQLSEQGGGAQSVPPPFPLDPLKQSTESFPMEDSLRQTAKGATTGASMMDKVKAWGASASAVLNTLLNHRSNGCSGTVNPIDVHTGGETIEDGCAQEPQQPDKTMGNSVTNVGAVLIGSVANEVVSSAAKPKKPVVKRSNAVSRLFGRKTARGKNPKDAPPKDSALDQCTTEEMGPAGFPMSPTFSRQYRLGRVLGEGGFGIVMAATRLKDGRQQMRHSNIIQYIDHMMEADASSTPTEDTRGGKVTSMDLFECIGIVFFRLSSSLAAQLTFCFDIYQNLNHRSPTPPARTPRSNEQRLYVKDF